MLPQHVSEDGTHATHRAGLRSERSSDTDAHTAAAVHEVEFKFRVVRYIRQTIRRERLRRLGQQLVHHQRCLFVDLRQHRVGHIDGVRIDFAVHEIIGAGAEEFVLPFAEVGVDESVPPRTPRTRDGGRKSGNAADARRQIGQLVDLRAVRYEAVEITPSVAVAQEKDVVLIVKNRIQIVRAGEN